MTESEYVIRRAHPGDEEKVLELVHEVKAAMPQEQQIWLSIDSLADDLKDLGNPKIRCWLALAAGKNTGKGSAETGENPAAQEENPGDAQGAAPEKEDAELAAIFYIVIPGLSEHNLGRHVGFSDEELLGTIHMDTAAVRPGHRGHGLQKHLMKHAEEEMHGEGYTHFMGTVHPQNRYSHAAFDDLGYRIVWSGLKYGGKPRDVMEKDDPM